MATNTTKDFKFELWVGDIIRISSPLNETLNDNIFLIVYIDQTKMQLINVDANLAKIRIPISEEGIIGDGNINRISILSRNKSPSYAIQNNLLPDKWVDIHFGGEYPAIITGEITNLEDDMIEITTIDKETIYIDFDYKGIPEDLPITQFVIREKPSLQEVVGEELDDVQELPEEIGELREQEVKKQEKIRKKPEFVPTTKERLTEIIFMADQVHFSDEILGPIVQFVDVSTKSQRYSLETQVTDLLDELLSTIPTLQRTPRVLNDIHIQLERFKQLREKFSYYDQYGNVEGRLIKGANYKPLYDYFDKLNINLYWILPVVTNMKKIYDALQFSEDEQISDVIHVSLTEDLRHMIEVIQKYHSDDLPDGQNMYSALYTELIPFLTPYEDASDEDSSILINKRAIMNINTTIDNNENIWSSVFNNRSIKERRFVIQKYNNALTKMETDVNLITKRVNITENDVISIKSFLTLPEAIIRFSKINLPGTNILEKANLNLTFLNYWQLLKPKTVVHTKIIDSLDKEITTNEANFANSIKQYVLNLSRDEAKSMTKSDIYAKYANNIIPKTKVLFNLMKKYITGKLSIVEVVSYLEPFLIYSDDLTYMQYIDITSFIDEKISENNRKFNENSRLFKVLPNDKSNTLVVNKSFSITGILKQELQFQVFNEGYDINESDHTFTNSEILQKIIIQNYSKLYTTAIALQNVTLMFPSEYSSLFEDEKSKLDKKLQQNTGDKCSNIVIAKFYKSLDALESDNDNIIYFDKKYDTTNYGILEDKDGYEKQVLTMDPDELKEYIIQHLTERKKMQPDDALYLAESLLNGHKRVVNGQYAILYKGYHTKNEDEVDYYIRKHNKWVLDEQFNAQDINTDDNDILCNLQSQCVNAYDKCESMETNELGLQTNLLKDVINEFDNKYKISKEEFESSIRTKFKYFTSIVEKLSKLENIYSFKYNNEKYKLSISSTDNASERPISPYAQMLNVILGQRDFVKTQNDIVKFCNFFTRKAVSGMGPLNEFETDNWLYCNKTNVPLIPIFKLKLAEIYTLYGVDYYQEAIELFKQTIGKQSDDGDWWCDKHSGWSIDRTDFDNEEGYEEGFKVSTRANLEEDAGNKIMSAVAETRVKYETAETIMINKVVNALSFAMGINIENQKEFIINVVSRAIETSVPSERAYKKHQKLQAEKQKKTITYEEMYHTSLLFYTLAACLIAIQTSIPSVKTRKTHPGCIRSFMGYPFGGTGDDSSVAYVACVAYDIRDSGNPWNILKRKKQEDIIKFIKRSVDSLLENTDTQRKFEEKTEYLLTDQSEAINEEHDIARWIHFLPPLMNVKIKHLSDISSEFRKSLMHDFKSGSLIQNEKILIIQSKMILHSIAIIEKIQNVVKKHTVLLHTGNNEPYLENACCESKDAETTIDYFVKQDSSIQTYNTIVNQLENTMDDITHLSKGGLFFSKMNTKNKYPLVVSEFTEKTIYLAFISFCKFNSLIPIPERLIPFCTNKPENGLINASESVDSIIRKLKADGRNYNEDDFLRILQIVSNQNIINIDLNQTVPSSLTKFDNLLQTIHDEDDPIVEKQLCSNIQNAIDTFTTASENYTKEVKDLNNYLSKSIVGMKERILDFIQTYTDLGGRSSKFKKIKQIINNLSVWVADDSTRYENIKISDDNLYNIVNFYKNFVTNMSVIFPNIILNKVNYKKVHIPNYYGFSSNHAGKLQKCIGDYYDTLKPFYDIYSLSTILNTVQHTSKNLNLMVNSTPSFTSVKIDEITIKHVFDERTSRFLFEYYLLKVFINYIELCDDDEMIASEVMENPMDELPDIAASEYLEDVETKSNIGDRNKSYITSGNKTELCQQISKLLVVFLEILNKEKENINTSYDEIQDKAFKLKEREKDMFTDRLKQMSREEREADTILKINKLEMYSKGLQKGLTVLDKEFYDKEQEFRDQMNQAEKNLRKANADVNDENIDMLLDDYMEQQQIDEDIDKEAYNMGYMGETYYEGNTDGVGAPEEEYDDYHDEE